VLIVGASRAPTLRRAFERHGHHAVLAGQDTPIDARVSDVEAVILAQSRGDAIALCRRLKTRYQVPFLPVVVLLPRPPRLPEETHAPDAWVTPRTRSRDIVARVEELVRIRRAESELVRLNRALAELAAENGRLYERARREAEATTLLLRELQHRVRNNLAAIQALLVLERHRSPQRPLADALDVAIGRLRSMAALQDVLAPSSSAAALAPLVGAVARGVFDIFGAAGRAEYEVVGDATVSARTASSVAIILNELMTNALKHAGAHRVRVAITSVNDGLTIEVIDDGSGMPEQPPSGSGLTIARAVARNELRGELSFQGTDVGTRAVLRIGTAAVERPPRPAAELAVAR
jgi:two-component sensor histidine kinase